MKLPKYNDAYALVFNDDPQFQTLRRWIDEENPHPSMAMRVAQRVSQLQLHPQPDYPDYDMGERGIVHYVGCPLQPANDGLTLA